MSNSDAGAAPKTIIFADDSATMRKVAEITFAASPFNVMVLSGGAEVAPQAKAARPSVIVLDAAMPDQNGYDTCRQLKGDPDLAGIPVLLMGGPSNPVDEGAAGQVGASDHIVKPFETQAMLDKVQALSRAPAQAPQPAVAVDASGADLMAAADGGAPARPKTAAAAKRAGAAKTVIGLGSLGNAPGFAGLVGQKSAAKPAPGKPPAPPAQPAPRPAAAKPPAAPPRAPAAKQPPPRPPVQPQQRQAPVAREADAPRRAKTYEMSPEEVKAIEGTTREIIERVVWEVVPELAETIIREELAKLLKE